MPLTFYIYIDSITTELGLEQDGAELLGAAKTNIQFRVPPPLEEARTSGDVVIRYRFFLHSNAVVTQQNRHCKHNEIMSTCNR